MQARFADSQFAIRLRGARVKLAARLSKFILDPLRARGLGFWRLQSALWLVVATLHRKRLDKVTFVAITGSAGKTTTKMLTTAVLSTAGRVRPWPGTANNFEYIARIVVATNKSDDFCVVEFSAERPGYLDGPLALVRPQIGVVTSIGMDHIRSFHSVEKIADEKAKIVACLPEQGVAVLNADDPLVYSMRTRFSGRNITFGLAESATLRAENIRSSWPERLAFTAVHQGFAIEVKTQLCGTHWVPSVLAALAVGLSVGITLTDGAKAIESVEPITGRMEPITTDDGVTFIMDDWKCPHWSVETVFDYLATACATRKIIVIGTISDFAGDDGPVYSRVAKKALEVADHVFFVGSKATHAFRAKQKDNAHRLHIFSDVVSAAEYLGPFLCKGDFVVVKGSGRADHLGRLALHRLKPISCWRIDCGKKMLCQSCGLLRSEPQRNEPANSAVQRESHVTGQDFGPLAMLPRIIDPLEVLVGLGNPGNQFRDTPHNVGFQVLEAMAEKLALDWTFYGDIALAQTELAAKTILLVKFQRPINYTGKRLKRLSDVLGFTADDCILIQDDINLPLGKLRTKMRGSDGGHKGIQSALIAFQTNEIRRLKIGVAPANKPVSMSDYILTPFTAEAATVMDTAREAAVDQLLSTLRND